MELPRDFTGTLRAALAPLVGHVRLDLDLASELAGVNPRTVHRRLVSEGTTWRAVRDELRFEYSRVRLADPGLRLVELALELGYADSAHFTRAFRRWTRVTPSQFRESLSEALC
jgi:AraC-like DNA-binding protein